MTAPAPAPAAPPERCPTCKGQGFTWTYLTQSVVAKAECPACAGTGQRKGEE